jgi:hypothetical protein
MRRSHGKGENNPLFNRPRSIEVRNKIRTKLLGHPISIATREKISKTIHERLPEYVPKLKAAWADPVKRSMRILEHNPNWQGGISYEPYCIKFNNEFKERVRAFFGYRCVECGARQGNIRLSVHHVTYNKKVCCDNSIPLFVSLCHNCHSKTHGSRQYWIDRFTKLINEHYNGKCYFTTEEFGSLKNV